MLPFGSQAASVEASAMRMKEKAKGFRFIICVSANLQLWPSF